MSNTDINISLPRLGSTGGGAPAPVDRHCPSGPVVVATVERTSDSFLIEAKSQVETAKNLIAKANERLGAV